MTSQFFSLVIRRVLFILVGKSNLGYKETWYNRVVRTFGKDKASEHIGSFYREKVNANIALQKTIRHEGASTLSKGLEMSKLQLLDFIAACDDRTPVEIQELVESQLFVRDLIMAVDATYVRNVIFELFFHFNLVIYRKIKGIGCQKEKL